MALILPIKVMSAPITIVEFNFENATKRAEADWSSTFYTADNGIVENLNQAEIKLIGPNFTDWASGYVGSAPNTNLWTDGANTKYWQIAFSTIGYDRMKLSSRQNSTRNDGPSNFKLQWSLDGTNWNDIEGAVIAAANNWTDGVIDSIALPNDINNQEIVYLRWIMINNISANGSTVGDYGNNLIDEIVIMQAHPKAPTDLPVLITAPENTIPEFQLTCVEDNTVTLYINGIFAGSANCVDNLANIVSVHELTAGMYQITYTETNSDGESLSSPILMAAIGSTDNLIEELECVMTTQSACTENKIVALRLSGADNAHAELASQATANYDDNVICCGGISGLNNLCVDNHVVALNLSKTTNAHVEQNIYSNYAHQACLQVPTGGRLEIAYQNDNCDGYQTSLASMHSPTNAHLGDYNAYPIKICANGWGAGNLFTSFVNSGGVIIPNPVVTLSDESFSFTKQVATGALGVNNAKIRISNATSNTQWNLSIAAENGPSSTWSFGEESYAFNDPSNEGSNGQMTINPQTSNLTPKANCTNAGLNKGGNFAFSQGVIDSITLLSANSEAQTHCYWDITDIQINQTIPPEQAVGEYDINLMLSIVAY